MPSEPRWWYEKRVSPIARVLQPIASVYGAAVMRRMTRTQPYVSRLPVICVGNFTAGGTGKTPLTQRLARQLQDAGAKPCILTRGYGGRVKGPHWVNTQTDTADTTGDEPLLLAAKTPVLVARDRAAGARAIEQAGKFTHILMDDGLQNPTLKKSLAIAVVDGRRGVGNGQVMPSGPLRAPLAFQLDCVDAIVVNHGYAASAETNPLALAEVAPDFSKPVLHAHILPRADTAVLRMLPLIAYAGIGAPQHFFSMLQDLGFKVADAIPFPDHHAFTVQDAERLLALAHDKNALLVTTAKDMARLSGQPGLLANLRGLSNVVQIQMAFDEQSETQLNALLQPFL